MGVQRGEAPLAGAGQRPAGVWGGAPRKQRSEKNVGNDGCFEGDRQVKRFKEP